MRIIDHLVYAVSDLEKAINDFEKLTGICPAFGGYHAAHGTKNAVVNLGNSCYLEILAVDDLNEKISAPCWMGVDFIEKGQLTRFALKSDALEKDSAILKKYNANFGEISGGQRETATGELLKWEMILPLAAPAVDLVPFMCNWSQSEVHPTDSLPLQCELLNLHFTHPNPELITGLFNELGMDSNVVKGEFAHISAEIKTPNGSVKL